MKSHRSALPERVHRPRPLGQSVRGSFECITSVPVCWRGRYLAEAGAEATKASFARLAQLTAQLLLALGAPKSNPSDGWDLSNLSTAIVIPPAGARSSGGYVCYGSGEVRRLLLTTPLLLLLSLPCHCAHDLAPPTARRTRARCELLLNLMRMLMRLRDLLAPCAVR